MILPWILSAGKDGPGLPRSQWWRLRLPPLATHAYRLSGCSLGKIYETKKSIPTLLADNTQELITTKQTVKMDNLGQNPGEESMLIITMSDPSDIMGTCTSYLHAIIHLHHHSSPADMKTSIITPHQPIWKPPSSLPSPADMKTRESADSLRRGELLSAFSTCTLLDSSCEAINNDKGGGGVKTPPQTVKNLTNTVAIPETVIKKKKKFGLYLKLMWNYWFELTLFGNRHPRLTRFGNQTQGPLVSWEGGEEDNQAFQYWDYQGIGVLCGGEGM